MFIRTNSPVVTQANCPPIWVKDDGCSGMALNMAPHKHTSANSRKQKPAKAKVQNGAPHEHTPFLYHPAFPRGCFEKEKYIIHHPQFTVVLKITANLRAVSLSETGTTENGSWNLLHCSEPTPTTKWHFSQQWKTQRTGQYVV